MGSIPLQWSAAAGGAWGSSAPARHAQTSMFSSSRYARASLRNRGDVVFHQSLAEDPLNEDDDDQTSGLTEGPSGKATRRIPINEKHLSPSQHRFCSNYISTAKYSVLSFIPCFLYEQFQRYSNCFFLFIGMLQQIPDVSPTGRYTTIVPLIFILTVSAVKEIIEDFKRHRADNEINHRSVEVLRGGKWLTLQWQGIEVGDLIKVHNDTFFPADMVILSSSEPQAMCYIETANLDGETNLKIRQGLADTARLLETKDLHQFSACLDCEPPNFNLYDFVGTLSEEGKQMVPLGPDQLLLRGAKLKNTNWVFGVVVYTGVDSKLMQNSSKAPLKRSTVDKMTNTQILMLFLILLVLCIISAAFNEYWNKVHSQKHWYLGDLASVNFFYNLLTFIILFNNLIPISLQVSLEVVRFFQAIFINMDMDMYDKDTDTPAMARTSNLNEELGQVKFIFSDKTGTLTRNVMEFKKCSVAEHVYGLEENPLESHLIRNLQEGHPTAKHISEFLTLMAVCHTVIPERGVEDQIHYHAASPDERALVYGAGQFGFVFETRTPEHVIVNKLGIRERYEILNVLEFTSTRKRMSVIARGPSGKIKLYCKGADTVIYERLGESHQQYRAATLRHLEDFATEGLRTLCCAVADIPEEQYEEWKNTYYKASTSLQNRDQKLDDAANLIESDLRLLGATAIEDKLQEGVPEAIAAFFKADIHVWVLTGDKQETAINIGYSCHLLSQGMQLLVLNEGSLDTTRETIGNFNREFGERLRVNRECTANMHSREIRDKDLGLIVDGKTLTYALTYDLRREFLDLCIGCRAVICCRVSPLQKAEVVGLVTSHTRSITLAIGDGANDVAMIQKANVGVGISGVEGLQACCASDYAIAQFRFLTKLLFVHGAWNYNRMCKLILYSFYKNICLYVIELWFAIYSGWSGQILFERWTIGLYNVMFTAWPPLAIGLFDRMCSAESMMAYPALYKMSQSGQLFNKKVFWVWICNAMLHSMVLYWLPLLAFQQDVVWGHGRDGGYLVLGNTVYSYVVMTVCLKAALVTNSWTRLTHLAIWGSIMTWFMFLIAYSNFWPWIPLGAVMLGQDRMVFSSPVFWLGLVLVPFTALLLDVTYKVIRTWAYKSVAETVRESEIHNRDLNNVMQKEPRNKLTETARLLKNNVKNVFRRTTTNVEVELTHGYAFSQEEHGAVTQSEVIRAYNTNLPKPEGM